MANRDLEKEKLMEERWIDYLEKELEPSFCDDLEFILEREVEQKAVVDDYKVIKAMVKQAGELELPTEAAYYNDLHEKIMAKVNDEEINPQFISSPSLKRNVIYFCALVFCLFSVTAIMKISKQSAGESNPEVAKLSFKSLLNSNVIKDVSEISDTVLTHEGDKDILLDSTAKRLDELSDKEVNELLKMIQ